MSNVLVRYKLIAGCLGGVQESYSQTNYTLGGPFFRALYVEFCSYDRTGLNDRLHIAQHAKIEQNSKPEFNDNLLDIGENDQDLDPQHLQIAHLNADLEDLASSSMADSNSVMDPALRLSVMASAQSVGAQLGLATAFGAGKIVYVDPHENAVATYSAGPVRQLAAFKFATGWGLAVDRHEFNMLCNDVQQDFNSGKMVSSVLTTNYSITVGSLHFYYNAAPGGQTDAVSVLSNAVGLLQWSRIDGLQNLFSWSIYRQTPMCSSVAMGVHLANSTLPDVTSFGIAYSAPMEASSLSS